MKRKAGILLPITSLPSPYGIGCFSQSAYDFIDWLKEAGQSYWQILPLGPTSYGDSPYQSFSTFAGNPYFISLEALVKEGVLHQEECDAIDFGNQADTIDYEKLYKNRYTILYKACFIWCTSRCNISYIFQSTPYPRIRQLKRHILIMGRIGRKKGEEKSSP